MGYANSNDGQFGERSIIDRHRSRRFRGNSQRGFMQFFGARKSQAEHLDSAARYVLGASRTCTMICDDQFDIVYANRSCLDAVARMEQELSSRTAWGGFRADMLVGSSLRLLFTDDPQEFNNVTYLRRPYEANIGVGPYRCEVRINPFADQSGFVVEWADVTEQANLDLHVARVESALHGANTNIMIVDPDFNLIYMNESSMRVFREIEPDLKNAFGSSFRADNLIGRCIDDFHKNPEHQRKLMKNEAIFPYKANIQVGPLTLALIVNGVKDKNGKTVAYSAEWADITAKLALEAKVQEQVRQGEYLAEKIAELKDVTLAIARGDLSQKVQMDKDDDIGQLGNAFNDMTTSLLEVADAAREIAAGNLNVSVKPRSDKDVLGNAFQTMIRSLLGMANAADEIAGGNLTVNVKPQSDKDVLGIAFEKMVGNLSALVAKTGNAADNISRSAEEVSASNLDLSQRTEEQASSLEETAASMEEMTSTVKQNADNSRHANQLAAHARELAEKGGAVVGDAVSAMGEINQGSKKIAEIISVIDEIAFQTNLLALNASVEAARVGEQGRGFAVVAAEVRNLAGRSATAAKEIKSLVSDMVQKVQDGSGLVNQSGAQLQEIVGAVKKVADIIAEISAASIEQSAGIEQVNKAVMQMDQMTQQNAALVEEAAGTSESMTHLARELQTLVANFKIDRSNLQSADTFSPPTPPSTQPLRATGTHGIVKSQRPRTPKLQLTSTGADSPVRRTTDNSMNEFEEF